MEERQTRGAGDDKEPGKKPRMLETVARRGLGTRVLTDQCGREKSWPRSLGSSGSVLGRSSLSRREECRGQVCEAVQKPSQVMSQVWGGGEAGTTSRLYHLPRGHPGAAGRNLWGHGREPQFCLGSLGHLFLQERPVWWGHTHRPGFPCSLLDTGPPTQTAPKGAGIRWSSRLGDGPRLPTEPGMLREGSAPEAPQKHDTSTARNKTDHTEDP